MSAGMRDLSALIKAYDVRGVYPEQFNEAIAAELGAAFVLADLDIAPAPRAEHASYIASWLKALNDDKRAIFAAAAHAQRAADYLSSLQPQAIARAA